MTLHYLSERSIEDSLSIETGQNAWVVLVSYLCMLVYISLALGRHRGREGGREGGRAHHFSERSIEDSLSIETSHNTWVVLVSYLCMLIYLSLALGRH